jgi:hypothetical protein
LEVAFRAKRADSASWSIGKGAGLKEKKKREGEK